MKHENSVKKNKSKCHSFKLWLLDKVFYELFLIWPFQMKITALYYFKLKYLLKKFSLNIFLQYNYSCICISFKNFIL